MTEKTKRFQYMLKWKNEVFSKHVKMKPRIILFRKIARGALELKKDIIIFNKMFEKSHCFNHFFIKCFMHQVCL